MIWCAELFYKVVNLTTKEEAVANQMKSGKARENCFVLSVRMFCRGYIYLCVFNQTARTQVKAKSVDENSEDGGLSQAARRILESLEQMSTPISGRCPHGCIVMYSRLTAVTTSKITFSAITES